MHMKSSALLVLSTAIALSSPLRAEPNEAALVESVKRLGANWERILKSQTVVLLECDGGGFVGVRARAGTHVVGIDLQRTNSLMSPYRGIVEISGAFETNDSKQNGACHSSPSAAKLANGWWGLNLSFDMRLTYDLENDSFKISGGNELFMNQFFNHERTIYYDQPEARLVFQPPVN